MGYAEYAPAPALASFVRCIWTFDAADGAGEPSRIVPDGRPELIVHLGDPFSEIARDGVALEQPRMLFAGQVTRPLVVKPLGRAAVIGVRFHPAGALPFLGTSLRDATDVRIDAVRLLGEDANTLLGKLRGSTDPGDRLKFVQDFVQQRVRANANARDPTIEATAATIEQAPHRADVAKLAAVAGIGRRQFERRFAHAVGVGPALLAAIFRFRGVFDVLERDTARPWTDAALAGGYHDQSHFIREFRRFVGLTPTEFARTAGALADALAQPQRDVAIVQADRSPAR
jgi:AraC-like DNA-binding protein